MYEKRTYYLCDPKLNTECKKTTCIQNRAAIYPVCNCTSNPEYALKDENGDPIIDNSNRGANIHPRGTDSAKVMRVIETKALSGSGTTDDPLCQLTQYWSFDGRLLAEHDG